MHALISRYMDIILMPSHQVGDREQHKASEKRYSIMKYLLLFLVFPWWLGMVFSHHAFQVKQLFLYVIGITILIFRNFYIVISVVTSITFASDSHIMWISVVILVVLFQIQKFETGKLYNIFALILLNSFYWDF